VLIIRTLLQTLLLTAAVLQLLLLQARVYANGEGVPYYMLRELAVLKDLSHPNITALRRVNLHQSQLRIFFDYVPTTLHDFINPTAVAPQGPAPAVTNTNSHSSNSNKNSSSSSSSNSYGSFGYIPQQLLVHPAAPSPGVAQLQGTSSASTSSSNSSGSGAPGGSSTSSSSAPGEIPLPPTPLPRQHLQPLLRQLVLAVAACHRRGVLHRNLKPKHLLVQVGDCPEDPLVGARLLLSDFALVRLACYPRRAYTSEVVTLWYR
jgi:serine/threonine protein kinase